MGRHFVFLCVCCVIFTVTNGQFTQHSQRHSTRIINSSNGQGNQRFSESKFISSSSSSSSSSSWESSAWTAPDHLQPSTGHRRFDAPFEPNFPRPFNPNYPTHYLDRSTGTFRDNFQPSTGLGNLDASFESLWDSDNDRVSDNDELNDSVNQNQKFSFDDLRNAPLAQSSWETARRQSPRTPARPAPLKKNINVCGISSSSLVQGGEAVQDTEFPWLGGLFARASNMYLCTVNLISAKHAVTAARCFANTNADNFGIRWGHPRTSQSKAFTSLRSITVHPGYNQSTSHDVAVIELSNPVTFTLSLKPICVYRSRWSPYKGITGMVAGFGPNYEDLKKVEIPIVTLETCRASNVLFHHFTSEFTFCAGTRNHEVGPCLGDSGAGYMQWVNDRYHLRGLVSFSLSANGKCNLQEYIIFADLAKEVEWLVDMIS